MSDERSRPYAIKEIQLRREIAQGHAQLRDLSARVEGARKIAVRHNLSFTEVKRKLERAGHGECSDPRINFSSVAVLRSRLAEARKKVCGSEGALARVVSEFKGHTTKGAILSHRHELVLEEIAKRKRVAIERADDCAVEDAVSASLSVQCNELNRSTGDRDCQAVHLDPQRRETGELYGASDRFNIQSSVEQDSANNHFGDISQQTRGGGQEGSERRKPESPANGFASSPSSLKCWHRLSESGAVFDVVGVGGRSVEVEIVSLGKGVVRVFVTPGHLRDRLALRADRDLIVQSLTEQGLIVRDFVVRGGAESARSDACRGEAHEWRS